MITVVPKYAKLGQGYSKKEQLKASEAPGRNTGVLAGTWVADLVACMKLVILCPFCINKFNPKSNNYVRWRQDAYSIGKCDDCNQVSPYMTAFIHESTVPEVGEWRHLPKKGRWSRKG